MFAWREQWTVFQGGNAFFGQHSVVVDAVAQQPCNIYAHDYLAALKFNWFTDQNAGEDKLTEDADEAKTRTRR